MYFSFHNIHSKYFSFWNFCSKYFYFATSIRSVLLLKLVFLVFFILKLLFQIFLFCHFHSKCFHFETSVSSIFHFATSAANVFRPDEYWASDPQIPAETHVGPQAVSVIVVWHVYKILLIRSTKICSWICKSLNVDSPSDWAGKAVRRIFTSFRCERKRNAF